MKTTKRSKLVTILTLVIAFTLILAACSADEPTAPPASPSPAPADPAAPPTDPSPDAQAITADIFFYRFADTFMASVRNDMMDLEYRFPNVTFRHHDANGDQSVQLDQMATAIMQGTDIMIVNIVTTGAEDVAMNIVNMGRDAGIPVLFFNREVSDAVINSYEHAAFIGTDAAEAGVFQGMAIAQFLLEGDNASIFDVDGDGYIRYVMMRGEHGNAEAFFRTYYSVRTANNLLAEAGAGITLVPSAANETSNMYADDGISNFFLYANWSAANAFDLLNTALAAHDPAAGDIEMIIANNDDAALGSIQALNEIGFNTGAPGAPFIPVFGVDATEVAMIAINDGRMTGTVKQDGWGMALAVLELANNIANGEDLMANTGHHNIDDGVAKIRIPHGIVS